MSEIQFGSLVDVQPRSAWADEARHFTPWLADNLGRLGDAIGLDLELIKIEAGLPSADDSFSADILARNLADDTNVLIENQLEKSDHRHLGQILTYLAGLEARTIVWVAPDFREAHLAAIKWLNESTNEEFSFFAIKVRVVRIGESALAPLFDVLQKPNAWERRLQSAARAAKELSPVGQHRRKFWSYFMEHHPEHSVDGNAGGGSTLWHKCEPSGLIVSYYLSKAGVGLFVRGDNNVPEEVTHDFLAPYAAALENALGTPFASKDRGWFFLAHMTGDFTDEDQHPRLAAWLSERVSHYTKTLNRLTDTL
ncbi:hypothetical protein [Hyphomonas oceanitis]|uniref:hypothetical protein n=1 Tax=Hyphomonas oceanitis TaxID=81033 RepID=UPI003002349E